MDEIEQLKNRITILEGIINNFVYSDRYIFQKNVQFMDGRDIQLARGTGTRIGTDASQKIGFFGADPVVQAAAISDPTGGLTVDSPARTAINSIITALQNIGITA